MRVLMLGWEYPPHISGGLGTACAGLTAGLARQGVDITFVVPHLTGEEDAPHMALIASNAPLPVGKPRSGSRATTPSAAQPIVNPVRIPARLSPYLRPEEYARASAPHAGAARFFEEGTGHGGYGADIFREVARYADAVVERFGGGEFDVVHAHDWMTFPAGVAVAQALGRPLVAHVHSLEVDRSGGGVNEHIHQTERFGVQHAAAVIPVSYYTRAAIHQHHGVPFDRMHVVHNGVYAREVVQSYRRARGWPARVVLFLGRITYQKGPDYFVEAAAKVVPHVPDVLFVMAGAGDMLERMVARVKQLGLAAHFYFPGFLRGQDVEQMFSVADLYVMPSVSEPFGISALEAISFDTPVIISRQSGVAEVLQHALKVDFWDIDRLADLMINSLLHDELREDMVAMAREEVRGLRWEAAAMKTLDIYRMVA